MNHLPRELSARERARRRGAIPEATFLAEMDALGFVARDWSAGDPLYVFTHPATGERMYLLKPGEDFAATLRRCIQEISVVKPVIVKLQRPTFPPSAAWLLTDRARVFNEFIAVGDIPSAVAKAMDGVTRGWFHAQRDDSGRWIFGANAGRQPW